MIEYLIQEETLTGIADAIRGKTGGTASIPVSDMAGQIEGIEIGGGDIDALIDRSITEISSNATSIGNYAFSGCEALTTATFPSVTHIGNYAFSGCVALTTATFPIVTRIGISAFFGCTALTTATFPSATIIDSQAFTQCAALTTATFPSAKSIGNNSFDGCSKLETVDMSDVGSIGTAAFIRCSALTTLTIRNVEKVCTLGSTNAFTSTPIASGNGYIYVPAAMLDSYKTATNWATYATQFRALEDYTVDGTTTGELDPAKTGT